MKCYDMRYTAKEIERARRYRPVEPCPPSRIRTPQPAEVRMLIEHFRCAGCGLTKNAAVMHSSKVYCKECAAKIVRGFLGDSAADGAPR